MIDLNNKNAFITGSSRGVGQQIALGLAKLGCNVIVHGRTEGSCIKTLELLELNPRHPSLRLHRLQGRLSELSSVSINMSHRILLEMVIRENDIILVDVGNHDHIYL